MEWLIIILLLVIVWLLVNKKNKDSVPTPKVKLSVEKNYSEEPKQKEIVLQIKPINRKNKLLIQTIKEKKIKCKAILVDGYLVCVVDYSVGFAKGRVLGLICFERDSNKITLIKSFDVQSNIGKFVPHENIRLDVAEFNDIEEETFYLEYINKKGINFKIENVVLKT